MKEEKKEFSKPEVEVIEFSKDSNVVTDSFTATADSGTETELP